MDCLCLWLSCNPEHHFHICQRHNGAQAGWWRSLFCKAGISGVGLHQIMLSCLSFLTIGLACRADHSGSTKTQATLWRCSFGQDYFSHPVATHWIQRYEVLRPQHGMHQQVEKQIGSAHIACLLLHICCPHMSHSVFLRSLVYMILQPYVRTYDLETLAPTVWSPSQEPRVFVAMQFRVSVEIISGHIYTLGSCRFARRRLHIWELEAFLCLGQAW